MKNLGKRKVRSHTKVRALFAENKVRFARAQQLWFCKTDYPSAIHTVCSLYHTHCKVKNELSITVGLTFFFACHFYCVFVCLQSNSAFITS